MPTTYLSSLAQPVHGIFLSTPRAPHSEEIVPAEYASLWKSRTEFTNTPVFSDVVLKKATGRLMVDYRSPPYFPSNLDLASLKERHEPRRDSLIFPAAIRQLWDAKVTTDNLGAFLRRESMLLMALPMRAGAAHPCQSSQ